MKTFKHLLFIFIFGALLASVLSKKNCPAGKKSNSKLLCYYGNLNKIDSCYCTHVILPPNADVKGIGRVRNEARGVKIFVSVNEFNQGLINLLKEAKVDGLEINLKKLDSKNDISDFISTVKSKLGSNLDIALSVPSKGDLIAKYFDFKALSKHTDFFILQTAFLGASTNVTFHPSRLSGMWDMQNTDTVVDLVSGLGAPLSKLVISAPVQAFKFTLQNEEYTAPGSPALELSSITRDELCRLMKAGKNWTLERDEDQAGPYIFRKNEWIAFEDEKSMDIKAKYARIRGLAGIALKDITQDAENKCDSTILEAAYNGLSRQARAPRGAVLHSLEREILESPSKSSESVQLSPFRISRIIDTEGKIHVVRQDSRTEFKCSRQGYFVHPRSCNRFYRCVKFNQQTEDYNVFEFDCPAGLAFDERVEVCVWPGSLPHGTPCSGSSEIAPVPRDRFVCPSEPGYYADPENCRWFFACLDHGKSLLSAYEFRCPFGLVFDSDHLVCEWPWLVPRCASELGIGLDTQYYYGDAGYSGKGGVSAGAVLQNYNGIGSLHGVKLGGLAGHIEKPISTVYSNVDGGAFGSGYTNDGGYIIGGGLNSQTIKSLQNAGLLKVNNGAGYQFNGQQEETSGYSGSAYANGELGGAYNAQANGGLVYNERYNNGQNQGAVSAQGKAYSGNSGAVSSQSFTQYHGQGQGSGHASGNGQYQENGHNFAYGSVHSGDGQSNAHVVANGPSNIYNAGSKLNGALAGTGNAGGVVFSLSGQKGAGGYGYKTNGATQYQGSSQIGGIGVSGIDQGSGYVVHQEVDNSGVDGKLQSAGLVNVGVVGSDHSGLNLQHQGDSGGIVLSHYNGNSGAEAGYIGVGITGADQTSNLHLQSHVGVGDGGVVVGQYDKNNQAIGNSHTAGFVGVGVTGSDLNLQHQVGTGGIATGQYDLNSAAEGKAQLTGFTNVGVPGASPTSGHNLQHQVGTGQIVFDQYHLNSQAGVKPQPIRYANIGVTGADQSSGFNVHGAGNVVDQYGIGVTGGHQTSGLDLQHQVDTGGIVVGQYDLNGQDEGKLGVTTGQGAISTQTFKQYHGPGAGIGQGSAGFVSGGQHSGYQTHTNQDVNGGVYVVGTKYVDGAADYEANQFSQGHSGGAVSNQNFVQYHGNDGGKAYSSGTTASGQYRGDVRYNSGIAGSVNIVGGGYSAVGTVPGIDVTNNGEAHDVKTVSFSSTVVPETVTTYIPSSTVSSIPTVTSVPVPGIKTNVGFETFKGGVIANIPELQYKVHSQSDLGLLNITSGFANVVVTTPASPRGFQQTYAKEGGYIYNKPSTETINTVQISTARPFVSISTQEPKAYISSTIRPVTFVQGNVEQDLGVVDGITYSTYSPNVNIGPAVSTVSFQKYDNNVGVKYEKPLVAVAEQPQQVAVQTYSTVSTPKTAIFIKQEPQVFVSSTPATPAVSTYTFTQENNQNNGYVYEKPSVVYEKSPKKPLVISKFTIRKPEVQQTLNTGSYYYESEQSKGNSFTGTYAHQQPAIVTQYYQQQPSVKVQPVVPLVQQPELLSTYTYQKPSQNEVYKESVSAYDFNTQAQAGVGVAKKEEKSYSYQPTGGTSYQYIKFENNVKEQPVRVETPNYAYTKPTVIYQETHQPAEINNYHYSTPVVVSSTPQPQVIVKEEKVDYTYPKPTINFEETPIKPVLSSQPAVVNTYFNIGSPKPEIYIKDEGKVGYSYPKPTTKFEETPITYSTEKPISTGYVSIASSTIKPDIVVNEGKVGYNYPKSQIHFEHIPVTYSTPKPAVVVQPAHPAVVTSYFNTGTSSPAPKVYAKEQRVRYTYPKLQIKFEEVPVTYSTPRPVITSSYNYVSSTTPQPNVILEEQEQNNYYVPPKATVVQEPTPAVVTSYFNLQPSRGKGYRYPKPAIPYEAQPQPILTTYEDREPVQEVPYVKKTAYVTGQYQQNAELNYEQPKQVIVENYQFPEYEKVKQTVFGQKIIEQQGELQYHQPQVVLNYVTSTPKPTFISTVKSIATKNLQPVTPAFVTYYDSRYSSTPKSYISSTLAPEINVVSSTSRPASRFSFSSVDDAYQYNQYTDIVKGTTAQPTVSYLPVTSTVRITSALPKVTKAKIVETYIAPEVTTAQYEPIRIRTKVPLEVTTPSKEYLPVRQRVKVTSTTATPFVTTEYNPIKISTGLPQYIAQPVYPSKTIIKQNDAHPLLSAKLGAQCTCASNTLKLRKNQKIIIVDQDDDNDDDGYVVDNGAQGRSIENYSAEPVLEITPTPEGYVSSSTVAPRGYARKRVKVRPYNPVTEVSEIFIKKDITPADDYPSDKAVLKAVRTGLKLVKQAAKEGAREGTHEALSRSFDRYGPGGVRSRSETLQGTIDCQRAGLFRHPTECNKFYACRWDCTKDRFTLHVFNCPVHLTFDNNLGACNWPSQGPACIDNTLITSD